MSSLALPTNEMTTVPEHTKRYRFIDGIRGFAAISVVLAHLSWFISQSSLNALFPDLGQWIHFLTVGSSRYFFVITGFVLTHLLIHMTPQWAQFRYLFSRRFTRLSIPYWASLFLGLALIWMRNLIFTNTQQPLPSVGQFIAHLLYVQSIFSTKFFNIANWTLSIDLQFFTCYTLGWFLVRWRMKQLNSSQQKQFRNIMILGSVPIALLAVYASLEAQWIENDWFVVFAHIHIMGILCFMSQRNRLATACLVIIWVVSTIHFYLQARYPRGLPTSSIMTLLLFLAVHRQALDRWLINPLWQFLGRISYSLFLTHMLVLPYACNLGKRLLGDTPAMATCWLMVAFALTFVSAYLFYLTVERPVGAWVRSWKRPSVQPSGSEPSLELNPNSPSGEYVAVNAFSAVHKLDDAQNELQSNGQSATTDG